MSFLNSQSTSRGFDCSTCPKKIARLRRCKEDRWDFGEEDGPIWPLQISDVGGNYGFCPGKATWDHQALEAFSILSLSAEMGVLYNEGGIINQPSWYMELMTSFAPIYDKLKFTSKVKMVLGDGSDKTPQAVKNRVGK